MAGRRFFVDEVVFEGNVCLVEKAEDSNNF